MILLVSGSCVYFLARNHLYNQLDARLEASVQIMSVSLTHEIEEHLRTPGGEADFLSVITPMRERSFPQQSVSVFDGSRAVVRIPSGKLLVESPPPGAPAGRSVPLQGGAAYIATRSVHIPSKDKRYLVCAAESTAAINGILRDIRMALGAFSALALLLAAGAGYYMARESLRPVTEMSSAVNRISSRNLSQTLPVANPDDELGELAGTFNDLLQRLATAFDQQRRFIADASHELKTPLSVALLSAQVALDRPRTDEEYRDAITTIRSQLVRLNGMIRDMLTLARIDAGAFVLDPRPCDLAEVTDGAVRAARVLAAAKNISIAFDAAAEMPYEGNSDLLQQLVLILLDNAIKYSPAGSRVRVSLQYGGGQYRLSVTDAGSGVPVEARNRIFDRFYRADASRSRNSGGAGLGLSIARWIASVHGASVELETTSPSGSTFTVILPFTPAAEAVPPRELLSVDLHGVTRSDQLT